MLLFIFFMDVLLRWTDGCSSATKKTWDYNEYSSNATVTVSQLHSPLE